MTQALILIDIQNDYFTGGLWPVDEMEQVAQNAAAVLQGARARNELIIHIQHLAASATAAFFRPDTFGAEIHKSVTPTGGETVIRKHRPNSFHQTELHATLQAAGITAVTLVGAMTQMCIDATARAARDFGYDVTLVANACGAKATTFNGTALTAKAVQAAFLAPLEMSYATVI